MLIKGSLLLLAIFYISLTSFSQFQAKDINWTNDGNGITKFKDGNIIRNDLVTGAETILVKREQLVPDGKTAPLSFDIYTFSYDNSKLLIYTNTAKVWRYHTRGDYWVLDITSGKLIQLGKGRPSQSLMFAKLSPDNKKAAWVSEHNIYVEDLSTHKITPLTKDGTRKLINGTFDWAYEEEFFCRDGFRWSPDSKQIAYWQIDARKVKDYLMINNTDSIYPFIQPVEYPIAGEAPSPFRIGVVNISTAKTKWMNISTDPILQSYVPRMEWAANSNELIIQHLNRHQNKSDIELCNVFTGKSTIIYSEKDAAWIDILPLWDEDYSNGGWDWLNNGKEFLWASEKDGWRHLYRISRDGKKETLITKGNFDVMDICTINIAEGYIYFYASPENATQKYLYRTRLDGNGKTERLSPADQPGTHTYNISPSGKFAMHTLSNYYTPRTTEWVTLPGHTVIGNNAVSNALRNADKSSSPVEFFTVKTQEGIEMDGWMAKPVNFDRTKKYPVVFYVYTEPWGQEVKDQFGISRNPRYAGSMSADGYIYIAIDNRGTPVPKGREWRKIIHRKIGVLNISDQAMAAREILKWEFVDTSRIAVWGWSGGGAATLNLMFQYPEIYKTGIAVAAVSNEHTYDNIYQERYMGLPQENREDYTKGSPLTYVKNFRGKLLYIHGTGDDNVHYNNAEMLLNEMIKHNKQFQFMPYPNRTHSISEGEGTRRHLVTLFTEFLKTNCPPGGREK